MSKIDNIALSIFLTTKCNLNCTYCYIDPNDKSTQTIDIDFVKDTIDYYFNPNGSNHLRFYASGEPTLEFELIKKIKDYAISKVGTNLVTEIQTNGFFSEKICEWIANNIDQIWISYDGPPEVHDQLRKTNLGHGTSKIIEKNVLYLTKNGKGMTGIRTTVSNLNIFLQEEFLKYYHILGIKNVWADPISKAVHDSYDIQEINPLEFAKELINVQPLSKELGITYGSSLTCNFSEDVDFFCRACLPSPRITTDGYISACDMAYSGLNAGELDPLIFGHWDKEKRSLIFDNAKIKNLRDFRSSNLTECEGCPAISRCGGWCIAKKIIKVNDNENHSKKEICDAIRYLYKNKHLLDTNYEYCHP